MLTLPSTEIGYLDPEQLLQKSLRQTLHGIERRDGEVSHQFANATLALVAMPFATGEYGLLINRLKNAEQYIAQGEWGAARYELLLIQKRLAPESPADLDEPAPPHPRIRPAI